MADANTKMKVLELFCGVGGMHWALQESRRDFELKCAVDINTVTNSIYKHNFPHHKLAQREIQSLTLDELNELDVNTLLMSPPCQPFTRVGLKKDLDDKRTDAFISVLQLIEKSGGKISHILVENVQGFESSTTRDIFVETLTRSGYIYQEFLLTPLQFSIPNSRQRYYCIAKHESTGAAFPFIHQSQVMSMIPDEAQSHLLSTHKYIDIELTNNVEAHRNNEQLTASIDRDERIATLEQHLEDAHKDYLADDKVMRHYEGLDIRHSSSRNSCCFTKRYGHYHVGSGSFLATSKLLEDGRMQLRFFTPREIASVMCFPKQFELPECVSRKQCYRALGNSLNVYVVANLIRLLTS